MLYAILGLVDPGDEVLVPDPGYPIYESLTRFVGATPIPIPIRMSNDFRLDVDELASLITPRTRVLVINSPANPTGGVLTRSDLERIAELAIEHDLWVLADEIYGRILYDGAEHVSIASLPGMAERTIVLDGFSKTFAMTGWRMGYAIVPEALVKIYGQLIINTISGVATFAQVGAVEALVGPQDDVDAMVVEFKARRDLIVDGLNAIPGHRVPPADRRVLRLPDDRRDRAVRRRPGRAAAPGGRRLRPAGLGVRRARRRPHPDQLRQLAGEPAPRRSSGSGRSSSRSSRPAYERAAARLRRARIPDEGLDPVRRGCDADVWEDDLPPPRDELLRRVAGCDGVLTLLTDRVDDEFLDAAGPGLRVVSNYAVGFDNIDVAACAAARRRGRQHAGRPDRDDRRPRLGAADGRRPAAARGRPLRPRRPLEDVGPAAAARAGRPRRDDRDRRLRADRPGRRAARPGLRDADPVPRRPAELPDEVTSRSARPTCRSRSCSPRATSCRSTSTSAEVTRHLINADDAGLDEADGRARQHVTRSGRRPGARWPTPCATATIAAAALDVTDPEPIPMDDPLVGLDNCLIVPHIASASRATRGKMAAMAAANLLAGVRGEPLPTPVSPPA